MDPPFGGRVEPLVHTLRELSATYRKLCDKSEDETLPVLWAFPYFAEPYIRNIMPEMKMHDYQVIHTVQILHEDPYINIFLLQYLKYR